MTNFNKSTILSMLVATLLIACGQSTTDTAGSPPHTNLAASSTQPSQATARSANSPLLQSLAAIYPNGQPPAANAAQAAKELAQNPAVLRLTAQTGQNTANPIRSLANVSAIVPVMRIQNATPTGAYFFTIYDTERDAALANNPNWKLEGDAFFVSNEWNQTLDSVHRFRNKINGSYLYTSFETEKADIIANYASTFVYEGVAWYAWKTPAAGWSPLYRFRNMLNGTYLFTAYESEKVAIEANYSAVFKLEGVAYYVKLKSFDFVSNGEGGFYDKTECVKDYSTGLTWQGHTPKGTGLRANDQYKTNYDSTTELQKFGGFGDNGAFFVAPTQAQIDDIRNSVGFKNAVNASNLCGSRAWRLPTTDELQSIVKSTDGPTNNIYTTWFPNNPLDSYIPNVTDPGSPGSYWTSTPYPLNANEAWYLYFDNSVCAACSPPSLNHQLRGTYNYGQNYKNLVRLVHD